MSDAIEYESPHPECRVTATADPFAAVRLDVSRKRAATIAKRVSDTLDAHSDGMVKLQFGMDRRAYTVMSNNLSDLLETEAEAIQVVVDENPEISVFVILNRSQIQDLDGTTSRHLKVPQQMFMWQISASENGARLLKEQIIHALKGADEPLEVVKADE